MDRRDEQLTWDVIYHGAESIDPVWYGSLRFILIINTPD